MSSLGLIWNIYEIYQYANNQRIITVNSAWLMHDDGLRNHWDLITHSVFFLCSEWWHTANIHVKSFWFASVHGFAVGWCNAHEICIGEVNDEGHEEEPNHECFLCWGNVSNNISSGVNNIVFVEVLEVADIPDCKTGEWNYK